MLDEEQHLGVPVVGAERPAMMEDNWLAVAPVLVKNFHAVFGFDEHDAPFRDRAIAKYACPSDRDFTSARAKAQ
jgi:hypothetical protein